MVNQYNKQPQPHNHNHTRKNNMPNTTHNHTKQIDILVTSRTKNKKTGDIPTIIVGQNTSQVVKSCKIAKCKLLHTKLGGKGEYKELGLKPCYAHNGSVSWGTKSIYKALAKGSRTLQDYALEEGFRLSSRTAKYFRCSSIGDISAIKPKRFTEIIKEGVKYNLESLGYTANEKAHHLKESLLLSCTTIEDADKAVSKGWRATTIFKKWNGKKTFVTPSGNKGIICPEQTQAQSGKEITPRNKITCNTCGLCAKGNRHTTKYKVVGFITHN
tara:strand:+ start:278 stop:1090 length:813 start_codon:yes stop_codon:yes gene_type:complete